jgi:hypothetical protein
VHTGISPLGGDHTIPFSLIEGMNQFKLIAGGFGIEETWHTNVTLDSLDPVINITSPIANSRFAFSDGRPFDLWIRGETEAGFIVNCSEYPSGHTSQAVADSTGMFSVAHPRQRPDDVYDGMESVITCSVEDAAGNAASTELSMTFDGTSPNGAADFIVEGQNLWLSWELSTTDDLDSWRITIVHDGVLYYSESGTFNGSWPDEFIEFGEVEAGDWNVTLMAWDSAGNMLLIENGAVVEEPETVLDTFANVPGGTYGVFAMVFILLLILVYIDRLKKKQAKEDLLLDSLAQEPMEHYFQ